MADDIELYRQGGHRNILLADATEPGLAVQSNHHLIVHERCGLLVDPGGHRAFSRVFAGVSAALEGGELRFLLLTHQDPDVLAATNGWLMVSDAEALVSDLWMRFVPHFALDTLLEYRLKSIPDEGLWIDLAGAPLVLLPAHFLHSPGNFQLYDPEAKILYSGDLAASNTDTRLVDNARDMEAHLLALQAFHHRYLPTSKVVQAWVAMARTLDIEVIAPQHGAVIRGQEAVQRYFDWCEATACGIDRYDFFKVPPEPKSPSTTDGPTDGEESSDAPS